MTFQDDLPKAFQQHNARAFLAGTVQSPKKYVLFVPHTAKQMSAPMHQFAFCSNLCMYRYRWLTTKMAHTI